MEIELKKIAGEPLYIQLYNSIVDEITQGYIQDGFRLPARRKLAKELNIAQITVDTAYKMLQDTGYAIIIPRQGCFVSFKTTNHNNDIPWEGISYEKYNFSENEIDKKAFPRADYAKILRNIAYNDGIDILSHPAKNGEFALRSAISKYLYSFRNIKSSPWQVIIGAGLEYLLTSFATIFTDDTVFAMEDSGYSRSYFAFASYVKNMKTIPVDMDGLKIEDLYKSKANIFYTTPYYHHPTGHKMTTLQKEQLLAWVSESPDRYIIEDCFDCELIFGAPESLYSMDKNNKVILLNSFSRSISSSFKTSYMVIPDNLVSKWKDKHQYYYALTPPLEQLALAEFIDKGYFVKHYKTTRRIYRERREVLKKALYDAFGSGVIVSENSNSTCVIMTLNVGLSRDEIILRARKADIKFFPIQKHCIDPSLMPDCTFILGIGGLTNHAIKEGIQNLKNALITD